MNWGSNARAWHAPPVAHAWTSHARRGDFEAAWEISDRALRKRAACTHLPRHLQWVWDGTPLAGKRVLIRCYHGLGDTIQFIRYAPLVKAVAAEVIVWAPRDLVPLLESMRGIDRLLPLHDGAPDVPYDVDVESMELPHVFRTTIATMPADVAYLHAPARERTSGDALTVGVAWRAGTWDERRSLPAPLLAKLADVSDVRLTILRHEPKPRPHPNVTMAEGTDTVTGTATLMRALDLIISVDSMPAHLAGALGVPVWTLLRRHADWRWMTGRRDSPWYPTMRLFRQQREGMWEPVIEAVVAELARLRDRHVPKPELHPE